MLNRLVGFVFEMDAFLHIVAVLIVDEFTPMKLKKAKQTNMRVADYWGYVNLRTEAVMVRGWQRIATARRQDK